MLKLVDEFKRNIMIGQYVCTDCRKKFEKLQTCNDYVYCPYCGADLKKNNSSIVNSHLK